LYAKLIATPDVTKKFGLYSHEALKKTLKLAAINPSDAPVMKTLSTSLAIRFVISGRRLDDRSFVLKVARTADGKTVFEKELRNSDASTALLDAVMVFQSGKQPVYRADTILEERRR
jgi:hypothetical protein